MAEHDKVIDAFHTAVFKLVKVCKSIEPGNIDIETAHKLMITARRTDPLIIIETCKDHIWKYREKILNRDEDFFLNDSFLNEISESATSDKNAGDAVLLKPLIALFQKKYKELRKEEQTHIWSLTNDILACVAKHKKITNDFTK